ncbi:MAG: hypothetical protein SYR96_26790 [Actinomycetota bacterium]|nr:hypothetical protein [Actinomycetota bacterium]
MEALRLILLFIHLIGFALLLGGAVTQFVSGKFRINPAVLWGSIIQLLSGIALSAPLRDGDEPSPFKLGVKLLVAVLIFIMVFLPRKRESVNKGHFIGIIVLTLVNAAVAVFWR